ncbi:murein biosynthesis integral membrane protein MurJ [Legionella oakridgensis]|uniref:Probable lipid II flippase MurJ n=2 Tax=Legionella oakridgensis TaxID=29423 RepID=W0BCJ5_9GAMM|nr:murein biosynthesis integral membrane protein MurJ [Legionella oakridgensis]AHE66411.1 integral membrane protein MviN [Legionella oakridgensis ATCC 33761 = DSM 21215]ETO93815.1 integral membrane protein MviN [Legionella oakridgensis RV-2-2007]KTD36851.1 integral membrane protein [Legionella oakridgensis]STY19588.1 integral membrane protein [Legionella longbeachae]
MSVTETMLPKRQSLLRSTTLVSVLTFFSRIMGFARDMILANLFGTQAGMDAFFVAFKIPNFMRRLFAEGAFSQAFVPVLAEYQQTRSVTDVRIFLARIAGSLSAVLSLVTVIGVIASPYIVFLFAPGFGADSTRSILATEMLRLTFPYLMLVSLTAMAGAILNTYGYFGVPAFTPVLLNICMIFAAVWLSPHFSQPVIALAWGVLLAGIVQLLFQLPFLYHRRLLVKPSFIMNDSGVRKVLALMVPALFGVSIAQINLLIDTVFASFLKVGSVSWLFFTDRLTDFPLGVFGVAIATVILPHLSRRHAEQSLVKFSRALDWGLRLLLLIGIPSGLGLALFAMPLIACCFAYGEFSAVDVLQTQKSLFTLALGVPAFMMVKVLASGFYARQNIKTPVKVGVFAMIINTLFCALLIGPLAHAGLTLASTIAGYVNCGMLLILLLRKKIYQPSPGWWRFLLQLLVANTVVSAYLLWAAGDVSFWMTKSLLVRIGLLLGHVLAAVFMYVLCLGLCGMRPAQFRGQIRE